MCNIQYGLTEEKANPSAFRTLGEEKANLSAFRTFVRFVLVWICQFPLPFGVWEGLRFMIVALPGLFSYLFFLSPGFFDNFPHVQQFECFCGSDFQNTWLVAITSCLRHTSPVVELICFSQLALFELRQNLIVSSVRTIRLNAFKHIIIYVEIVSLTHEWHTSRTFAGI